MSERKDPPPSDPRTQRRLARSARSIARRDTADQPTVSLLLPPWAMEQFSTTHAEHVPSSELALNSSPPSAPASENGDSEEDAPIAIAACAAEPTLSGEVAKRARLSSSGSDAQEDKRLRLCGPHGLTPPPPPEYTETSRAPTPADRSRLREIIHPPPPPAVAGPSVRPRHETPAPVSPRHTAALPVLSHSHPTDSATTSRSYSARSEQQSASWPKDSTSYAGLASPVSREIPMETSRVTSPQPSTSYAATAAAPASPRRSPPRAAPAVAEHTESANPPQPVPRSAYPPIVVESLPNWTRHFDAIGRKLGHAPNARPLGGGVRFLPKSADEFRTVQRYLTEAANQDSSISWYCYSPAAEVPTKIAIRGLPLDTPTEEVVTALRALGFPAEAARAIPAVRGKHGCTYYVRLAHLTHDELREIYAITELLYMPQITVEAWRGGTRPPQCHRCQGFAHNSVNCHRAVRCVRCAGGHPVRECPRSREDTPTCANCGRDHAANDRTCAVYKKEARRRGIVIRPPPPERAPVRPDNQRQPQWGPAPSAAPPAGRRDAPRAAQQPAPSSHPANAAPRTSTAPPPAPAPPTQPEEVRVEAHRDPMTLMASANPPTERGAPLRRRKRRNRAPRPRRAEPAAASTPQPRQPRSARAAAAPPPAPGATSEPAPTAAPVTAHIATVPAPVAQPRNAHQTNAPPTSTEQQAQGEGQTNPDIMAIVRVVAEALMSGLTTYLQGQGAMAALTAGLAVLTRLQSC